MAASDRIRQAIEALPGYSREHHWYLGGDPEVSMVLAGRHYEVCAFDNPTEGAYVALMQPIVGAALADLLEAIARPVRGNYTDAAAMRQIRLMADALEQAIERSQT